MSSNREDLDAAQARIRALEEQLAEHDQRVPDPAARSVSAPAPPACPQAEQPTSASVATRELWFSGAVYRATVAEGRLIVGAALLAMFGTVFSSLILPMFLVKDVDLDAIGLGDFVAAICAMVVLPCNVPLAISTRFVQVSRLYRLARSVIVVSLGFAGACGAFIYWAGLGGPYGAPTAIGYAAGGVGLFVLARPRRPLIRGPLR